MFLYLAFLLFLLFAQLFVKNNIDISTSYAASTYFVNEQISWFISEFNFGNYHLGRIATLLLVSTSLFIFYNLLKPKPLNLFYILPLALALLSYPLNLLYSNILNQGNSISFYTAYIALICLYQRQWLYLSLIFLVLGLGLHISFFLPLIFTISIVFLYRYLSRSYLFKISIKSARLRFNPVYITFVLFCSLLINLSGQATSYYAANVGEAFTLFYFYAFLFLYFCQFRLIDLLIRGNLSF